MHAKPSIPSSSTLPDPPLSGLSRVHHHPTVGRLAPSPTGNLHLGNAWAFLIAWLACRLENGTIFLRMEDIDTQRSKKEYANAIIKDLSWLGIDWDEDIIWQSERNSLYEANLEKLNPRIYKCYCTRKELRDLAGAPQAINRHCAVSNDISNDIANDIVNNKHNSTQNNMSSNRQNNKNNHFIMPDTGAPYHGRCRNLTVEERQEKEENKVNFCLRLACPPFTLSENKKYSTSQINYHFNDLILGEQNFSLTDCGGDFALRRSDGIWAYQLAVSSDDMASGINQIVRGNDILTSTPRQLYLYSLLGYAPPRFAHIPLLLDENGDRLAKRHVSMSLEQMRLHDNKPTKILSYLANLMGIEGTFSNAKELLQCLQALKTTQFPWKNIQKYHGQTGIIINNKDLC